MPPWAVAYTIIAVATLILNTVNVLSYLDERSWQKPTDRLVAAGAMGSIERHRLPGDRLGADARDPTLSAQRPVMARATWRSLRRSPSRSRWFMSV
jgi:hypothetical protein